MLEAYLYLRYEGGSSISKCSIQLNQSCTSSYFLVCIFTTEPSRKISSICIKENSYIRHAEQKLPANTSAAYQRNLSLITSKTYFMAQKHQNENIHSIQWQEKKRIKNGKTRFWITVKHVRRGQFEAYTTHIARIHAEETVGKTK